MKDNIFITLFLIKEAHLVLQEELWVAATHLCHPSYHGHLVSQAYDLSQFCAEIQP